MQLDKNLMMCDAMSIAGANATFKCDRTIPLQTPQAIPPFAETGGPHDLGFSRVNVMAKVVEAVTTTGGAGTVKAQLVMADSEDLGTGLVILQSSEAIPELTLLAGYEFRIGGTLPPGTTKLFVGVQFVTAGETLLTGKVTATLPYDRDSAAFV